MDQITPLTESIHKMAQNHPIAKLLITIPGIGPITAMTIIAEIENITRFPSYRHLSSYAGLVPSLKASAGKQRIGKITKQGSPYLRTALIEAAQSIARMKKCRINLFFRRIIVRSGYKKAIVATAHKILQIVFYVWKNKTPISGGVSCSRVTRNQRWPNSYRGRWFDWDAIYQMHDSARPLSVNANRCLVMNPKN